MADNLKTTAPTTPEAKTCVDAQCHCNIIWSLAQQFSMRQIVTNGRAQNHAPDYREGAGHASGQQIETSAPAFVRDSEVRARRIAAAYARVFLEDFHLGDKSKVGRFYWLALGAFASKQVAATLGLWRVRYGARWSELRDGLGRGNLWLFNDVLAWFYAYAAGGDTFEKCFSLRNSDDFVDQVKVNFTRQKDYAGSIDKVPYEIDGETGVQKKKLGNLRCTPIIVDGFSKVKAWEQSERRSRPDIAFSHLILIAQHEQGEVLQGLIYDDKKFRWWLDLQRGALATSDDTAINHSIDAMQYGLSDGSDVALSPVIRALVPNLQLVLTAEDNADDVEFKSSAPDRLVLHDYQKRMEWIGDAAKKFHTLMQTKPRVMIGHLESIKGWSDKPDR
ncbi:DUF2515 family protein [Burkholderia anthina]|uniref:DUF2515 family protein n=1 Tax=Burkholderia anthina TaxID=179879 RepID=UPI0015891340